MVKKKEKKEKLKLDERIIKALSKKIKVKKILKQDKMTLTIKKREIEPYKPIYFNEFIENEKRSLFLS